jgi:thioredoxin 1
MSEHIHHVTDDTFDRSVARRTPSPGGLLGRMVWPLQADRPVARRTGAVNTPGRLKVAKINIDENQATPRKLGVKGIPTLQIFKNGNLEAQKVGAVPKSQLKAFIDSVI